MQSLLFRLFCTPVRVSVHHFPTEPAFRKNGCFNTLLETTKQLTESEFVDFRSQRDLFFHSISIPKVMMLISAFGGILCPIQTAFQDFDYRFWGILSLLKQHSERERVDFRFWKNSLSYSTCVHKVS